MGQIRFTDITLREASRCGEGALSFKEIIEAAKILDRLNLDVISLAPIVNEKIDFAARARPSRRRCETQRAFDSGRLRGVGRGDGVERGR